MKNKVYPCFWMNNNAKEAALFYTGIFKDTRIIDENPYVVMIQSAGQNIMLLNGGEHYKINPSISLYVHTTDPDEVEQVWQDLTAGGQVMMPLEAYPWSTKYGFVQDKFGLCWQISLGNEGDVPQKFAPFFNFTGVNFGKAEEAVQYYTSLFPDSSITGILKHKESPEADRETVLHTQFHLFGQVFMAIDSGAAHAFQFSPGVSIVIICNSAEEIDLYWDSLLQGGKEAMCGWLSDRFGVSWQIVPSKLGEWMRDPEKGPRVAQAFMQMKKLDWAVLENA